MDNKPSKLPYEHSFWVAKDKLTDLKRCILLVSSDTLINWQITPENTQPGHETHRVTIYYLHPYAMRLLGIYCAFLDVHGSAEKTKANLLAIDAAECPDCFPPSLHAENKEKEKYTGPFSEQHHQQSKREI